MIARRTLLCVAALPLGGTVAALASNVIEAGDNDRRLGIMVDQLDALQAHADRHAAGAGMDPADPYTVAVSQIDLVAAGMAMTAADTMAGVLLKLRAMAVPVVADDDEAHGLALSVCRDLRRLQAVGALS